MKLNKINKTKFSLTNANNIEAFLHNFHITLFILFFFNYDLSTNLNFNVTKCFIIIQYKNSRLLKVEDEIYDFDTSGFHCILERIIPSICSQHSTGMLY